MDLSGSESLTRYERFGMGCDPRLSQGHQTHTLTHSEHLGMPSHRAMTDSGGRATDPGPPSGQILGCLDLRDELHRLADLLRHHRDLLDMATPTVTDEDPGASLVLA